MGLSKAQPIYFITQDGNVKRTGGGQNLAAGQVGIVDLTKGATDKGAVLVDNFSALSKRSKIQIRMGKVDLGVTKSLDNKSIESLPFTLEDIVDLRVEAPEQVGIKVDDMIIGYNGKDGSEIILENGDNEVIQLTLEGKGIGYLGYKNAKATVQFQLEAPNQGDFTMQEIIEDAVERLKNYELLGQTKLTDYVDIITVNSENPNTVPNATAQVYYNLVIKDNGSYADLAKVQAKYPDLVIQRTDFSGEESTYTLIADSAPDDYVVTFADKLKGCEDCPAGYDEIAGGFIYSITIEDDGADLTTTIDDVPGFVTGSVVKLGQDNGVGTYSVVVDDELTESEIDAFLAASSTKATARFTLVGEVNAICENTDSVTTSWTEGETCYATEETYTITLEDDDCGNDRLEELQKAYPNLTIAIAQEDQSNIGVTLTGTSGTANITLEGTNYLVTFNSSLTQTAADFVEDHAATILANHQLTVTSSGAVINLTSDVEDALTPAIVNATGDLAGTIGSATTVQGDSRELCQTTYTTTILTNVVCDECDPAFRDLLSSEAPKDFRFSSWEKVKKEYSETAKMGIRFRAKPTILSGSEALRDDMDFIYEAPRLSLVGGYPLNVNESYKFGANKRFTVKILERYSPPKNYGGNLRHLETMSKMYFEGTRRHVGNNYAKYVFGEETRLDGLKQYADYALTIHRRRYTQGWSDKVDEGRQYHFIVEVGKHKELEKLLNDLAAAAGVPTVQAYANS